MNDKKNQSLLETYFDQQCPRCQGTKWLIEGGIAQRCECYRRELKEYRYESTHIPPSYLHCTLNNFIPVNDTQMAALRKALNFTENYETPECFGRGLMFRGPVGVGKTHLAVAVLQALVERGYPGTFLNFVHLIEQIKQSYDPERDVAEPEVLALLTRCRLVVMDELGATKPSEFVFDKLYDLINQCLDRNVSLIFTTNFLDQYRRAESAEIAKAYTLAERINERLRSRILGRCYDVVMEGPDYRLNPRKTRK